MRSAWLEVDLGAYRRNLRSLAAHTGSVLLPVVKANGYGHGLAEVARAALHEGCAGVGVALPEEGAELRGSGVDGRIVVLGLALEEQAGLIAEHGLEPTVTRPEMVGALARAAARRGRRIPVHVKVDTGMTRAGVAPEDALAFCGAVREEPALLLAGLSTHFAAADEPDLASAREQWSRFAPLAAAAGGWSPRPVLHAANSAAALWLPEARLDWIRPGLLTYGVAPGPGRLPFEPEPVASLKARVVQVREVAAGTRVSYGGTWTAPGPARLALLPVGYGDGIPWALSNRGEALLGGRRAAYRGRVCMDQLLLDVTDLPGVRPGEEAVFLGIQGGERIAAEEVARWAGTIPYEVLVRMAARLPRVYSDSAPGPGDSARG